MISQVIARIAAKQDLTPGDLVELQRWFSRMELAPDRLEDIFKGQSHIAQLSQIAYDLGVVIVGQLNSGNGGTFVIDLANQQIYILDSTFGNSGIQIQYNSGVPKVYIGNGSTDFLQYVAGVLSLSTSGNVAVGGALTHGGATVWDSANDGAASGLDADLLDGLDSVVIAKFGDGSEGDKTFASDTSFGHDHYYNNVTINAGVTVTTNGYKLYVAGTLTIQAGGVLDNSGNNGGNGADGGAGAATAGSAGNGATGNTVPGGVAGTAGQATTASGTANGTANAGRTHTFSNNSGSVEQYTGGGGAGGSAHGTVGTAVATPAQFGFGSNGGAGAAGTGAGSTSLSGGGGGGGGGMVWVAAYIIDNGGTISANGGNGGNGVTNGTDKSGNGGGGGGGTIVIYYHSTTGSGLGTRNVNAGAAGTGGNGGANGTAGTSVAYNI